MMRTIAKVEGFEITQDMQGSIFLNGRQFESAMDAARSVRDHLDICGELVKQVLEKNGRTKNTFSDLSSEGDNVNG